MAAVDVIDSYLGALPGGSRRLAPGEWGLTLPPEAAGGWPLEIGLRVADELLRVQAFAAPADDAYDPWGFLFVNRSTRLVRFGCTGAGDIWVHGDVPVAAVDDRMVDRLLGLVVEAAVLARSYAASARGEEPPAAADAGSWLTPR
ncbi:MAG: hypothetical protein WD844_06220 [Thermoleophilaceae bacterium]